MNNDSGERLLRVRRELDTDQRVNAMTVERTRRPGEGVIAGPGRLVVYTEDEELLAAEDPAIELGVDVDVVVRRGGPATPAY